VKIKIRNRAGKVIQRGPGRNGRLPVRFECGIVACQIVECSVYRRKTAQRRTFVLVECRVGTGCRQPNLIQVAQHRPLGIEPLVFTGR